MRETKEKTWLSSMHESKLNADDYIGRRGGDQPWAGLELFEANLRRNPAPEIFEYFYMNSRIQLFLRHAALLLAIGLAFQPARADFEADRQEFLRRNKQILPALEAGQYAKAEQDSFRLLT